VFFGDVLLTAFQSNYIPAQLELYQSVYELAYGSVVIGTLTGEQAGQVLDDIKNKVA